MYLGQMCGIASLILYLVDTYYTNLTSVLIVYDSSHIYGNAMQQQYVDIVQQAFENRLQRGHIIALQWINVVYLNDTDDDFGENILNAVDVGAIEGFITILANTSRFLHARYYATRYSMLRLKDKIYLFLCGSEEKPKDFLATTLLQFYPHHLMVIPETIYPEHNDDYSGEAQPNNVPTRRRTKNQNIKQISMSSKTTRNNLKITNVTTENVVAATMTASQPSLFWSFLHTKTEEINKCKYRDINFELWTQQYVGAEANLNAVLLDTYVARNRTFAKKVHLYPNKLLNLHQRTIRIGTLTYFPYVKTSFVPAGQGDVDSISSTMPSRTVLFKGAEANIMITFCIIYKCHLRVEPYAADNWGIIYENGSADGMLGDVYKQRIEMAIGCIYNWYNDVTETSQFIARSAVTILGPGPAKYPRWRTIAMPFSTGLWVFLVLTIIICSIMFHFLKNISHHFDHISSPRQKMHQTGNNYHSTLLDVYAVFIQQPSVDTLFHHVTTRIFLAFLLCATITLENTYSGQLKSLLTMPLFKEPVDTMYKWSLSGWKWAAPSIIWIHTVENSDLAKEQRLSKQFEVRDHEFLSKAAFRDNYGLALERVNSGSFSFGDYITQPALENKIIPKDDLYFDWTRAIAIRGWPLMPLLDSHILFCLESGLYAHWENEFSRHFLDNQIQGILKKRASAATPKSLPQMLSTEHISGPLFILMFGYLLAFIVFLIEIFGTRMKWGSSLTS